MVSFKELSQQGKDSEEDIEISIFGINPIPDQPSTSNPHNSLKLEQLNRVNKIDGIKTMKWHNIISLVKNKEMFIEILALIDTGAYLSCINEGLVPVKYFEKTSTSLYTANSKKLKVQYKLPKMSVCSKDFCIEHTFVVVKGLNCTAIIGSDFLTEIMPFKVMKKMIFTKIDQETFSFESCEEPVDTKINCFKRQLKNKQKFINFLKEEIDSKRIKQKSEMKEIQQMISNLKDKFETESCAEIPNAFWNRKKHLVSLPYEPDLRESQVHTKARPI